MPMILNKAYNLQEKKLQQAEKKLDDMFIVVQRQRLFLFSVLSPLVLGLAGLVLSRNLLLALLMFAVGIYLPKLVLRYLENQRKNRFETQLIDGLMVLSSSLKASLSFLQALEVLVEELPNPISQEFGLMLRENKMGVSLDESFKRLNQRMDVEELRLLTNAVLVARETGGDLTKVFGRLVTTIRDNTKLRDAVRTLTLQGRLQGAIMSVLPFVFIVVVMGFNRNYFAVMLSSEQGRFLLFIAVILEIIGIFLIRRFSRIRI